MEPDDRARMEQFLQSHSSALNLPATREGETIFEYVVDSKGEEHVDAPTHCWLTRFSFERPLEF